MGAVPITLLAYAVAALVWITIAQLIWHVVLRDRPRHPFMWTGTALATLLAVRYVATVPVALLDPEAPLRVAIHALRESTLVLDVALLRHLLVVAAPPRRPRAGWLAANYGSALAVLAVAAVSGSPRLRPIHGAVPLLYCLAMLGLAARQMVRFARPGMWKVGGLGELRRPDTIVAAGSLVCLAVALFVALLARWPAHAPAVALLDAGLALGLAAPFAGRILSDLVPHLLTNAAMVAAAAALFLGGRRLGGGGPADVSVGDLAAILTLVVVLGPGRGLLRGASYRLLRRSWRRRGAMQAFFRDLPPDADVLECCRRATETLARGMQVPAIGMILADGEVVVTGPLAIEPLARVWPRDTGLLPARPFGAPDFWDLPTPIQEALIEANVIGVVPVTSPRRPWGHFVAAAEAHLSNVHTDEDIRSAAAFGDQLALVLDGAELRARAVAVERSLAHAEKLAAIGETAARFAHDIRNPVTAARSLAQQLAQEPRSPFAAEHAVILEELERVERQVAALLRFARREDFRFEPVDLGELARATVAQLRSRLEAAGVATRLDVRPGVVARADAEKIRHVIVNLIENAIDALGGVPADRRLAVARRRASACGSTRRPA